MTCPTPRIRLSTDGRTCAGPAPAGTSRLERCDDDPTLARASPATSTASAGVVSRSQALGTRAAPWSTFRRLERRRDLVRVLPRVYLAHTGEATWSQRRLGGWCSYAWPAALIGPSALRAADGPRSSGRRPDADPRGHRPRAPDPAGAGRRRRTHCAARRPRTLEPRPGPGWPYGDAALDVALEARTEMEAIAAVARAVQSQRTTAVRMAGLLSERSACCRVAGSWRASSTDVTSGTCSVLEHAYLVRVELPHGAADRDASGAGGDGQRGGLPGRAAPGPADRARRSARARHGRAARPRLRARPRCGACPDAEPSGSRGARWSRRSCQTAAKLSTLVVQRGGPSGVRLRAASVPSGRPRRALIAEP